MRHRLPEVLAQRICFIVAVHKAIHRLRRHNRGHIARDSQQSAAPHGLGSSRQNRENRDSLLPSPSCNHNGKGRGMEYRLSCDHLWELQEQRLQIAILGEDHLQEVLHVVLQLDVLPAVLVCHCDHVCRDAVNVDRNSRQHHLPGRGHKEKLLTAPEGTQVDDKEDNRQEESIPQDDGDFRNLSVIAAQNAKCKSHNVHPFQWREACTMRDAVLR
mmetsp:Transcript_147282/g.473117  ORF Transcript_147282/g.473117 Transcript_147282/m.473117 type:complete len:215 (+) Transcript_147282:1395-2039(+)